MFGNHFSIFHQHLKSILKDCFSFLVSSIFIIQNLCQLYVNYKDEVHPAFLMALISWLPLQIGKENYLLVKVQQSLIFL